MGTEYPAKHNNILHYEEHIASSWGTADRCHSQPSFFSPWLSNAQTYTLTIITLMQTMPL